MEPNTEQNLQSGPITPPIPVRKNGPNVWMMTTVVFAAISLVSIGYNIAVLRQQSSPDAPNIGMPAPQVTPQPLTFTGTDGTDPAQTAANEKAQTYTNPHFPLLKIIYDRSWVLKETLLPSRIFGKSYSDATVTLTKSGTVITYALEVGTPMGGAPDCLSSTVYPYEVVKGTTVRVANVSPKGQIYWTDVYAKNLDPNGKYADMERYTSLDAFDCKASGTCFCHDSMDAETLVVATDYSTPAEMVGRETNSPVLHSIMKVYVKQAKADNGTLQEADGIVLGSIEPILKAR